MPNYKIDLLVLSFWEVSRFRIKNRRRRQVGIFYQSYLFRRRCFKAELKRILNLIYMFFLIFMIYTRDNLFRTRRQQSGSARNNAFRQNNIFPKLFRIQTRKVFLRTGLYGYIPDYATSFSCRQISSFDLYVGVKYKIFGGASVCKQSRD